MDKEGYLRLAVKLLKDDASMVLWKAYDMCSDKERDERQQIQYIVDFYIERAISAINEILDG